MVDWGGQEGHLPCHIWCFVVLEGLKPGRNSPHFGGIRLQNGTFAVVETGYYDDEDEHEWGKSQILTPFFKDIGDMDKDGNVLGRMFYLADTNAFVSPLAVVPDLGGPKNRFFVMEPRDKWVDFFEAWVNLPHTHHKMDPIIPPLARKEKKKKKKRAKTVEDASEERECE